MHKCANTVDRENMQQNEYLFANIGFGQLSTKGPTFANSSQIRQRLVNLPTFAKHCWFTTRPFLAIEKLIEFEFRARRTIREV